MNASKECAHPACNCALGYGQQYCSETCADAKNVTELACQCQHPACQGAVLKP